MAVYTTNSLTGTIIGKIIFIIIGLIFFISAIINILRGYSSKNWPSVQGKIIHSDIQIQRDIRHGPNYSPTILFEYFINGTKYFSNRISFGGTSTGLIGIQRILIKYPVGSDVLVYYNPQKPQISILEPGITFSIIIFLLVGIIFTIVGFFI
ncbi:DUF3592 domain-containing protein [Candidatus Woesearchaeota archaeon]|nr:DUF3592 domain-containing protein [Candidatus Woesearchaeota archaeon]